MFFLSPSDGENLKRRNFKTVLWVVVQNGSFESHHKNKHSMDHRKHWQVTILSKYIWGLKNTNTDCTISRALSNEQIRTQSALVWEAPLYPNC